MSTAIVMLLGGAEALRLGRETPSAEQALAQIEANNFSTAKSCLCFQYADFGASEAADPSLIKNGGALVLPDANGLCSDK